MTRTLPTPPADFGFQEEHALLRQEARRFLAERCPFDEVRRLAEDRTGYDPALWKDLAALGWVGLTWPEQHGGAGMSHLHLALVLEEMGRALLPSPYLACLLSGFVLGETQGPWAARALPAMAAGDLVASVALCEAGGAEAQQEVTASAEPADGGYVLRGRKTLVMAGAQAGLLLAPFVLPSRRLAFFAVELPSAGVSVEPEIGIDPTRRTARVHFDGARVAADALLSPDGDALLASLALRGAAALAAEMVGGAETTLELARAYAVERKQFGRQIGSFQAVKHPIVDTMVGVELARSHALAAACALDGAAAVTDAELPARMAKAIASDVFARAVRRGVQIHGGYGFTWDCDVHFYFKRALWSRATLGDATHHRRELATALFGD